MSYDPMPGAGLRADARRLAASKLTGDRFRQALRFIFQPSRRAREIEALMARLETLPDVEVDEQDRTRLPTLSNADIAHMRADRAAGAKLRELAEKYRVSTATASRWCSGEYADRDVAPSAERGGA